ncbi:Rieske-like 2Fe-2S protein [Micromonospora kangleipakensis]|uniref:Rieske-like 2Fe-2S protein n=1 Tax=Micromonospora kangleipakensis TaxID=1077942 RepID=A0A4Q8BFG3_9ACTN|nr:Rieske (2Fe-2S) protein [Micromonospora kangleipakensis]RZU76125.1 Rieske-like 2Fe-2S protein [Micromonospora kangleipakensis]
MSDVQVLTGPGTQSRRALLTGAGAVGAAAVLAACGGDDSGDGAGAPTTAVSPTATGGGGPAAGQPLKTTDIPVGGGKIFAKEGVVVTQPNPSEFKGFSSICTHQNCTVSRVEGGTINCLCHGSKFSTFTAPFPDFLRPTIRRVEQGLDLVVGQRPATRPSLEVADVGDGVPLVQDLRRGLADPLRQPPSRSRGR